MEGIEKGVGKRGHFTIKINKCKKINPTDLFVIVCMSYNIYERNVVSFLILRALFHLIWGKNWMNYLEM